MSPIRSRLLSSRTLSAAVIALTTMQFSSAFAAGAHVHGQGTLDVSIEGDRLELFLTAPVRDLQSGGNSPETLVQREDLFSFGNVSCSLAASREETAPTFDDEWSDPAPQETAHHPAAKHHDEHEQETGEEHAPAHHDAHGDEQEHHGDQDHAAHDEQHHAGEDHDEDTHSDSYLTWIYQCSERPSGLRVLLFDETELERLAVQAVSPSGVDSGTLTKNRNDFDLP